MKVPISLHLCQHLLLYVLLVISILVDVGASQVVLVVKNPPANAKDFKKDKFDPWVGKILWRRKWLLTPVLLPGKSHEQRSLAGYSPWGLKESDTA